MYSCFLHIFVLYSHQQCCDGHTSLLHSPAVTPVTPSPARCRSTAPHCSTGSRAARSPQQSGDMSSGRLRSEVTLHNGTGTSLSLRICCAFNFTSLTSSIFCKTSNYAGTFLEAHCLVWTGSFVFEIWFYSLWLPCFVWCGSYKTVGWVF